jgi:hypothetical protein
MTEHALDHQLAWVLRRLEDAVRAGTVTDQLSDEAAQRMLTLATKIYVSKLETHRELAPFLTSEGTPAVTPTEAVATASEMLDALHIEVFELGMWQAKGRL